MLYLWRGLAPLAGAVAAGTGIARYPETCRRAAAGVGRAMDSRSLLLAPMVVLLPAVLMGREPGRDPHLPFRPWITAMVVLAGATPPRG